jgi:glycosyltransferase involved in cell wall biosynthesis
MHILVLHITSDLYGTGRVLLTAVKAWIAAKHEVTVILPEEGPLNEAMRAAGAEVKVMSAGALRKKYLTLTGLLNRMKATAAAYRALKQLDSRKKIDLVYTNTVPILVGAIFAKRLHKPHLYHVHEIMDKPVIVKRFFGWMLQHFSNKVVVVSKAVETNWKPLVSSDKLTQIYNGIAIAPFIQAQPVLRNELGLADDIVLVGMIGRVNLMKGQSYFLEIAALLKDHYPQVHFVMVGDAYKGYEYLYTQLEAEKKERGLEPVVYDLGYREDIPAIMQSLDIFILPSQQPDSLPTVMLEAMACSKPVVATRQGGAMEIMQDGETGFFIPLHDATVAAEKIALLIEDAALRDRLGANGFKRLNACFTEEAYRYNINRLVETEVY